MQVPEILRYPIGKFKAPEAFDPDMVQVQINVLRLFPSKLEKLLSIFSDNRLNKPYRPGGWTVKQLVHHLGDSHHNSFTRFKWTLTEDKPVIKAYDEKKWAALNDSLAPISLDLNYLRALHHKWVYLLEGMTDTDWHRVFIHPESGKEISLWRNLALYAWHCKHHYAHIKNAPAV